MLSFLKETKLVRKCIGDALYVEASWHFPSKNESLKIAQRIELN